MIGTHAMTTADHAATEACPVRAYQLRPNGMRKVSKRWKTEARDILRFDIARALTLRNRTAELLRMADEAEGTGYDGSICPDEKGAAR